MSIGPSFPGVLAGAQEGAEWAWSLLYHDLAGAVLGYLRTRGASDPEDVLGEVFLQVARNIHTFQGDEEGFRSWIFVIAHRRLIDERRRRARRPEDPVAPEDLAEDPSAEDAEEPVLRRLSNERVRELFESLTEDQRDVLSLRIIGGLSLADTAEAMSKGVGAVKALQHRALASLRRELVRDRVSL